MSVQKKIPRIVTFDIMRGFFLIAIIVNHIAFFPNLLDWWGMRGYLLVTTAEGFFLLSGVVLGIVRGAKLIDTPMKQVTSIVLKRALTLFATYFVLVVSFTLLAWYIYPGIAGVKFGVMPDHNIVRLLWETLTLQYTYGWADYLRFYAIFIALCPIAFWLLRRGLWYIVLLASFLVWLLFPLPLTLPWQTMELMQPIPWQLIFFSGLVIGFHWPQLSEWCTKRRKTLVPFVAIPVVILAAITLTWNIIAVYAPDFIQSQWARDASYQAWSLRMNEFHKEILPWPRFLLFMLWFWAAFLIIKRYEATIVRFAGWLLIPFGTNSLYVYTLHAVIVFFVHIYFTSAGMVPNFLVTIGVVALIYAAIRTKFLMTIIPR